MDRKRRDLWVIEYTSPDTSRDATVAYKTRKEAVEAAADFARQTAKRDLEDIEWDPADAAPQMLEEILRAADEGRLADAVVGWLEFQQEYDPEERIAIGPSGSVSDSPHDFPAAMLGQPDVETLFPAHRPAQPFDVYIGRKLIDTVFYSASDKVTTDEVRRALIEHDGYDPRIKVVKRRMPK